MSDKRPLPSSATAKAKEAKKYTSGVEDYLITFSGDSIAVASGSIAFGTGCIADSIAVNAAQPRFSGFDKGVNSAKESFFVTNPHSDELVEVKVEITYETMEGAMLHCREWTQKVRIPSGETRRVDIPTWDTQHQFYYHLTSPTPKRPATPFRVRFRPLCARYLHP